MRLLDAIGYFKEEWLSVHQTRCLNLRHRMEVCDSCTKGCPQQAITVSCEDVIIDPALCNNCGLCVSDCPTGVFEHDFFNPMQLVSWAKGRSHIDMFCHMSGAADLGEGQARIPCHGMLGESLMGALKAVGVRELAVHGLSGCSDCPTRQGGQRLSEMMQQSSVSDAWPTVLIDVEEGDAGSAVQHGGADSGNHAEPVTSRRGFFTQIARKGAEGVASTGLVKLLEDPEPEVYSENVGVDDAALMNKFVPAHHRLALVSLVAGNGRGVAGHLHKITATDSCTGCKTCATRCPTGALSWSDQGESVTLNYRSAACIGCSLCVSICPYQALALEPQQNEEMVMQDHETVLFSSEQNTCEQCGDRFLPHDGDNRYCWICKNEMEMDHQWMSMLKTADGE